MRLTLLTALIFVSTYGYGQYDEQPRPSSWKNGYLFWNWDTNDNWQCDASEEQLIDKILVYVNIDGSMNYIVDGLGVCKDADGDGLPDWHEDINRNGKYDKSTELSNWDDADTDDDGLSDGFEVFPRNTSTDRDNHMPRFIWGLNSVEACRLGDGGYPNNPDSDRDGIGDGTEAGITRPMQALKEGLIYLTPPRIVDTDTKAIRSYVVNIGEPAAPNRTRTVLRFIPDDDPLSITHPLVRDSNLDGVLDGDQDRNVNGRCDDGETDAAAGWTYYYSVDDFGPKYPQSINSRKILRHHTVPGHVSQLSYIAPRKGSAPYVKIDPEVDGFVESIAPVADAKAWIISIRWASGVGASSNVWIEDEALIHGKTPIVEFFW